MSKRKDYKSGSYRPSPLTSLSCIQMATSKLPGPLNSTVDPGSVLGRWISSHYNTLAVSDEKSVARHTVNLLTSTIKPDAEQSDMRFCFRIISPVKTYTLQVFSDFIYNARPNSNNNNFSCFLLMSDVGRPYYFEQIHN